MHDALPQPTPSEAAAIPTSSEHEKMNESPEQAVTKVNA
jgi:hypothetical protein